jgi:hypothetical protein
MKRIFVIICICSAFIAQAQEVSVEKSMFSIQTGFLGIWAQNEARLSNKIALRSEIGLNSGIWGGTQYDKVQFLMSPVFRIEPRFYYNLGKRHSKSKRTDHNSGNFVSLETTFQPDWFIISNQNNVSQQNMISIIPTWGIKRNIGKHFNYEVGGGLGYAYFFKKEGYLSYGSGGIINILLRIGYVFKHK